MLKGHIAIADARFPKGTTGAQLDALARAALWQAGLDFDHGTGHGVGSYLSVHEGPQRISKTGHTALEPGMILSNEPGYYRAGDFGIRIENLDRGARAGARPGGDRPMHAFETVTLAPIDAPPDRAALHEPGGDRLARRLSHARLRRALRLADAHRARSGHGSRRRAGRSWAEAERPTQDDDRECPPRALISARGWGL